MKLHSKSELFLSFISIAMGIVYFTRGNILNFLFGAAWIGIGAVHLYRAFSRKWAEKDRAANEAMKNAARERFGKWAIPVRYIGLFLVIIGLGLLLFDHTAGGLILLLAGLCYTLIIESLLKDWAAL